MKLILRLAQIGLLALAGLYAGDYLPARYRIPGNRQTLGSVQVRTLWAVRMKDGRFEYSLGDTETQTCVRSLFPQLGYMPCWYRSCHATKRIEVSRAGAGIVAVNGKRILTLAEAPREGGCGQNCPPRIAASRKQHLALSPEGERY